MAATRQQIRCAFRFVSNIRSPHHTRHPGYQNPPMRDACIRRRESATSLNYKSTHIYRMYLSCFSLWYYKSRRTRKCHYIHVLLTPPAWLRALRKDTLERPLPAPRDPLLRVLHEIVDGGRPRGLHVVRLEPRVDGAHEVEELRGYGQYVMRRDGSRWGE